MQFCFPVLMQIRKNYYKINYSVNAITKNY